MGTWTPDLLLAKYWIISYFSYLIQKNRIESVPKAIRRCIQFTLRADYEILVESLFNTAVM